jgi:hypothetical protein
VRLRQVLTNLVSNAITYTERGEVFVRVAYPVPQQLHVAVLDSGIGIAPRELDACSRRSSRAIARSRAATAARARARDLQEARLADGRRDPRREASPASAARSRS